MWSYQLRLGLKLGCDKNIKISFLDTKQMVSGLASVALSLRINCSYCILHRIKMNLLSNGNNKSIYIESFKSALHLTYLFAFIFLPFYLLFTIYPFIVETT